MSDRLRLVRFRWDGEAMIPIPGQERLCDQQYVVGEVYWLTQPDPGRSEASHSHYFACLKKAHDNLPDTDTRWPTPEAMRKGLLIETKQCDERMVVCANNAEAIKLASLIQSKDAYAVINIHGSTVRVWTAISQSYEAMGKKAFHESKQKVLEAAAATINVSVDDLCKVERVS